MSQLRDISNGQLTGATGTVDCPSKICGGVMIIGDGTNSGTVTLKKNSAAGAVILQISSSSPLPVFAPFEADSVVYYDISVTTGFSVEIFEWVPKSS